MAVATLNITFIDEKGKPSSTSINVPLGFTIPQYVEFAQAFGDLLLLRTKCIITGVSISFSVDIGGVVKAAADVASNVATKIKGLWNTASGAIAKFLIPGAQDGLTIAGSNEFDQAGPDMAALISAYEDGIDVGGATTTFTNGRGSDVTGLSELTQSFRRRKAG